MSNVVREVDESLDLLKETKSNIRSAIEQKGVTVSDTDTFASYAAKIEEISSTSINNQDKTFTENGQYTADEGYTGLGTVTVNVPLEGDVVEAIAVGEATSAVENDKVLLNPATALTNPVTLDYTKTADSSWAAVNNKRNAPNIGVFSSTKGYAEMLINSNQRTLNQTFTWDSDQNKYIGTAGPTGQNWHVVWGTPKQMYYVTCTRYDGTLSGNVGTVSPDLSFNVKGSLPTSYSNFGTNLKVYKNYFCLSLENTYKINEQEVIKTAHPNDNTTIGIIEYNSHIYAITFNYFMGRFDENSFIRISGIIEGTSAIACLDSNSNYIIAGPYGTPAQFKIFKQLSTSDATNLRLEEATDLTAQLPINIEAQTDCNFYVIPIQDGQDFADIFIRYGGRLFYCKWDGTTLTNYGLITDRGWSFSFNPVERILFTNRAIVEDNTSDYQVFSFQGIMNKPFTAMDITSRNWSAQTLTGYVKSNEGQDEFGNTILKVNTVTDPNAEPWSDVGKLYGFNVNVEAGSL